MNCGSSFDSILTGEGARKRVGTDVDNALRAQVRGHLHTIGLVGRMPGTRSDPQRRCILRRPAWHSSLSNSCPDLTTIYQVVDIFEI